MIKIAVMTNRALFMLIAFVTVLNACNKITDPTTELLGNFPQYQLKAITWNNGLNTSCTYNSDSTLQEINYAFQSSGGKTVFGWAGKKLIELYDDRSTQKQIIDYDADGKVMKIRSAAQTGPTTSGYELVFRYNMNNKADSLLFFTFDEKGKTLVYASGYHYNNSGDLEKVITKSGSAVFTHTIDAWSPALSFQPAHYLETALNENYTVYNYAVLLQFQQSQKLPAKVTRLVQTGSTPAYVDKIEEQLFTVTGLRIDKVVSTISYPGTGYNQRYEGIYSYY